MDAWTSVGDSTGAFPAGWLWYVGGDWVSHWARDIEIREHKIYREHPRLCRNDDPVFRLRQWYRQFLPDDDRETRADWRRKRTA